MSEISSNEALKKQQFVSALRELGARGRMTEFAYQTRKEQYGSEVAEDVGRVPKLKPTSEALAQLLSTIPGIEMTARNRDIMTKPGSVVASEYCVSAYKQKDGNNYTGVSVSIPQGPDSGTHIDLERVYSTEGRKKGNRVNIALNYSGQGEFQDGEMRIGTIEESQFIHDEGGFRFDLQGRVIKPWGSMARHLGNTEKIDVVKAVHAVSRDENLESPIDAKQIITEITPSTTTQTTTVT